MEGVFLSFANFSLWYEKFANILLSRKEKFNKKENTAITVETILRNPVEHWGT